MKWTTIAERYQPTKMKDEDDEEIKVVYVRDSCCRGDSRFLQWRGTIRIMRGGDVSIDMRSLVVGER